jgi:hypothetical protein
MSDIAAALSSVWTAVWPMVPAGGQRRPGACGERRHNRESF